MSEQETPAMIRRRDAAQATLEAWAKQPLRLGHADCVRMTASHLRALGYKVKLPRKGSYRTLKSAQAALAAAGYTSLSAALDSMGLERIAPAAALVGDIVELESERGGISALTIAMGNGRVAGWHPDMRDGIIVMQPLAACCAWRVHPVEADRG